jgi:hypothetical protein
MDTGPQEGRVLRRYQRMPAEHADSDGLKDLSGREIKGFVNAL